MLGVEVDGLRGKKWIGESVGGLRGCLFGGPGLVSMSPESSNRVTIHTGDLYGWFGQKTGGEMRGGWVV